MKKKTLIVFLASWFSVLLMAAYVQYPVSSLTDRQRVEAVIFGASGGSQSAPTNCSSNPCTAYRNTAGISSVGYNSTGNYTVNFVANTFSAAPNCVGAPVNWSGSDATSCQQVSESTSSVRYACTTTAASATNTAMSVICMGTRQ